jgi:hypothetical protein
MRDASHIEQWYEMRGLSFDRSARMKEVLFLCAEDKITAVEAVRLIDLWGIQKGAQPWLAQVAKLRQLAKAAGGGNGA